jgi:hypothetical protein
VVRRVELAGGDGDDVPRLIIHVGLEKGRRFRTRRWVIAASVVILAVAAAAAVVLAALR